MKSYVLCKLRLLQDPDGFICPRRANSSPWSVKSVGKSGFHDVLPPGDTQVLMEVRASYSMRFYRFTR